MTNYKIAPEYLNGTMEIRLSEGHIYKNNGSYRVEYHCCGIKAKTKTFKKLEDAEEYLNKWINIRNSFCDISNIRKRTEAENNAGILAILSGIEPKEHTDGGQAELNIEKLKKKIFFLDKDTKFEVYCKAYINNILIPKNKKTQKKRGINTDHYTRRVSDVMSIFKCHIKDSTIGAIPISKLTQGDFYLFIESLSHTRAYKTVLNIMQFCSQVLNHALKRKHIEYNWQALM